jgi:hypothetical protein
MKLLLGLELQLLQHAEAFNGRRGGPALDGSWDSLLGQGRRWFFGIFLMIVE